MATATTRSMNGNAAVDIGKQPVLLNNPHGWANVTRFTALTMAKLSTLQKTCQHNGATSLERTLAKIEQRRLLESFTALHRNSNIYTFVNARGHAEQMMQRLHNIVDGFDLEVDDLVENIIQGTMEDEIPAER